jgi:hypothetical protein
MSIHSGPSTGWAVTDAPAAGRVVLGATLNLCLCLGLACSVALWPAPVSAQPSWDAQVYTQLLAQGRELRTQALAFEAGSEARRDLLVRSLSRYRQAQSMLRQAIVTGAVDAYRADAVTEAFNLTDNVIVELLALEQCEAAAAELEQLAGDAALLPPDAAPHLQTLRSRLRQCRERVSLGGGPWSESAYGAAVEQAERWRLRAQTAASEAERNAALFEATVAETVALDRLQAAARAGAAVPGLDAVQQLGVHYNRVVAGLLDIALCEAAAARIAERNAALAELGATSPLSDFRTELQSCRWTAATREARQSEARDAGRERDVGATRAPAGGRERSPWPWVLVGVGSAAAVAALAVDLTLIGDRGDFDDLQAACDRGESCNHEALSLLGDAIDRDKVVIGVLAGVAVAAGAAGIVWLLVGGGGDEAGSRAGLEVTPMAGPDLFGATLRFVH